MKIRYILLLAFAIFIDGLQVALAWGAFALGALLQSITPVGGAVAGAAAGSYACYSNVNGVLQGIADATKCGFAGAITGASASALGVPIGVGLGFVFDIIITLTFGSALVMTLILLGMYSPLRTWSAYLTELIPGLDVLPGWTIMTVLCVLKDRAKSGQLEGKAPTAFAKMLLPTTALGAAVGGIKALQRQKTSITLSSRAVSSDEQKQMRIDSRQQLKTNLAKIDGIKPAPTTPTDNKLYVQKAA